MYNDLALNQLQVNNVATGKKKGCGYCHRITGGDYGHWMAIDTSVAIDTESVAIKPQTDYWHWYEVATDTEGGRMTWVTWMLHPWPRAHAEFVDQALH